MRIPLVITTAVVFAVALVVGVVTLGAATDRSTELAVPSLDGLQLDLRTRRTQVGPHGRPGGP